MLSDVYFAGIGTARVGAIETVDAVRRGWYDATERDRGGLLAVSIAGPTPAPDLAVAAARRAIEGSGHRAADFAALFHTNVHPQGPDGWSAQHYINRHTIDQPVSSVEVRNGCVGFFSSLHLGACVLAAMPGRDAVMLTCADNFGTPVVDRWRASRLFVLADGGGAVVLSRRGGFARVLSMAATSDPALEERHRAGEAVFPPGITNGTKLNFQQRTECFREAVIQGHACPGDFGEVLVATVERALAEAKTSMHEIARVIHDGYTRAATQALYLDPLGIDEERGIWEFTRRSGHAGPVDQVRGLEHVWRGGHVGIGDKVLMVSDAPGMEAACCVVQICATP